MNKLFILCAALLCLVSTTFATGHPHAHGEEEKQVVKFVENNNQWESFVHFRADIPGGKVFFENDRITYALLDLTDLHDRYSHSPEGKEVPKDIRGHAFQVRFDGANPQPTITGGDKQPEYHNYFIGNDPAKWAGEVGVYGEVHYKDIYPGIALEFLGKEESLKYNFHLRPMANPGQIKMVYEHLEDLKLEENGNLVMVTSVGEIVEWAPYAYQTINGQEVEIACRFVKEGNTVKFDLGEYDHNLALVIDPSLIFASFTGSTSDNFGYTATYDDAGNLYGGGIAFGIGYPMLGPFQGTFGGGTGLPFGNGFDISISKFNAAGNALIYSTFLGGNDNEQPHSLITTPAGELIVYGRTFSPNYPVANPHQAALGGGSDIVITKFDVTGGALIGSTFIGGSNNDGLNIGTTFAPNSLYQNYGDDARGEVMIDNAGNIYIASCTQSSNFPTQSPIQSTFGGGAQDGVIFKMNPNLSSMIWGTYLGGSANDAAYSVKIDNQGNAFVTGGTESANFTTVGNVINPAFLGGIDGFITKIDAAGANITASTFMGTPQNDQCYFLEIDLNQDIYVVGQTLGAYPVSANVYSNAGSKQFIHKLDNDLSTTVYSTVFGSGSSTIDISPTAFLVDRCGFIYVAGWGGTVNFSGTTNGLPVTPDAVQSTTDGSDIYLIVLAPDAAALEYGTFFGGPVSAEHVDGGTSRFNPNLEVYHAVCAGCGGNSDFPVTTGSWSTSNNSTNCNLGVFKFAFDAQDVFAAYVANAVDSCSPFPVNFVNNSTGGVFYIWDYGDGDRDTVQSTAGQSHIYTIPGTYNVLLIAVDSNSCNTSDTALSTVTVYANPIANISNVDTICAGFVTQLSAQGGQFYDWSPGIYLSDSTIANPTASPPVSITYTVIVSDTNGCVDTADVDISVTFFEAEAGPPVSFCEGTGGAQLMAGPITGAPGPYWYEWWCDSTNTYCGLDSTFDNDPIALPTDTTTYYLQVTDANGCLSEIDSTVVNVLPVPIADAGPDVAICAQPAPGVILNGSFSNAPGPFDFYWTPGIGLNDSLLLNPFARPDTTTIYTLIGISANGCTSVPTTVDTLATVIVTVNPEPIADAGPDIDICFGDTTQLQGTGSGAGPLYAFEWSPYTGLSDSTTANPFANPPITTEYILNVFSNGCPSVGDTMRLTVHTIPTPDPGNIIELCLGETGQLDAFADGDSTANYTYQWSPPQGLNDPTLENPLVTPDTATWYTVVATSTWGCVSAPDSVLANLLPTPIAEAGPNQQICSGDTFALPGSFYYTTTGPVTDPSLIYYSWNPAFTLDDSTLASPDAFPDQSTVYYLDVIYNNCRTTDSMTMVVIPPINAELVADTNVICSGDSVQLLATGGLGSVDYSWIPSNGLSDAGSPDPMAAPDTTTLYQVVQLENGCYDTAEVFIEVIPSPVASYLTSVREGCAPFQVSFLDNSTDVINYIWTFGDGSNISNQPEALHTYDSPGEYYASLTVVNTGACSDTQDSILIRVFDPATAEFTANPGWPSQLALPQAGVEFTDLSTLPDYWSWDFGDGVTSTDMNPTHTYQQPGTYFVTLRVYSEEGCPSEVTHGPFVVGTPDLFIPNVFSPNGDEINEDFRVEYSGSQPFQVQIFDRWGVKHYESRNKEAGWKGTNLDGVQVPEGVYYYRIWVGDKDYAGPVTLVR